MGAPSRIVGKIRKTLADYSLRRFLRYAVQPWHWPLLAEMRRRKAREIALFGEQLASAIDGLANEEVVARHVFRPWLASAPLACPTPAAAPPISMPSDPELRMRVDAGADRRARQRQVAQALGLLLDALARASQLCSPGA